MLAFIFFSPKIYFRNFEACSRFLLLTTCSPVFYVSFMFLWMNRSFSSLLGEFPEHCWCSLTDHVFASPRVIELCFVKFQRQRIFLLVSVHESAQKAAVVDSQMWTLSKSQQSRLLSWVFTTLSQAAGIWKLKGEKNLVFLFYLIPARMHWLSSHRVLNWMACCLWTEEWNQSQWLE